MEKEMITFPIQYLNREYLVNAVKIDEPGSAKYLIGSIISVETNERIFKEVNFGIISINIVEGRPEMFNDLLNIPEDLALPLKSGIMGEYGSMPQKEYLQEQTSIQ
jgi:hypothetical protein